MWTRESSRAHNAERGRARRGYRAARVSRPSTGRAPDRAPTITQVELVASWRRTLDAFGRALEGEKRYLSPAELKELERHLAADRRWLERFAAIRSFP
jgi:hypothetical protein